jgi:hypothetical protein
MYARYTPKGKNENGRITESTFPIRCSELSSRKIGSTSAAAGMIITMSVSESTSLRPGKSPNARP